ncbi:MAG TPA: hypothetical protein VHK69_03705 [Chitinophagaceae bacterium]|jgi:hypothetical protein|nr:hypothetical protein [Chitinophagaceae bacterium]
MKHLFEECVEIVRSLAGHEYLYFDTSVEVKTSPHSYPFSAWGVCVSPDSRLYVMDSGQEWHEVEPESDSSGLVIGSLYQRLRLMRTRYAKAS